MTTFFITWFIIGIITKVLYHILFDGDSFTIGDLLATVFVAGVLGPVLTVITIILFTGVDRKLHKIMSKSLFKL